MTKNRKITLWVMLTVIVLAAAALVFFRRQLRGPATITGAITVEDADPRKQLPVADVEITALNNLAVGPAKSDAAGFFRLTLRKTVLRRQKVELQFRHPKYKPLDMDATPDGRLYLARLVALQKASPEAPNRTATTVSNI